MSIASDRLLRQRLKTAKEQLEDARLRMESLCAFILKQQSIVNRMEDELFLKSRAKASQIGQEALGVVEGLRVSI